jgi:hypothetical protein
MQLYCLLQYYLFVCVGVGGAAATEIASSLSSNGSDYSVCSCQWKYPANFSTL